MYYVKEDDFVYRFSGWSHLLEVTGKKRDDYGKGCSLAFAIRSEFKHAEIGSKQSAIIRGWIERNGDLVRSLRYGNMW